MLVEIVYMYSSSMITQNHETLSFPTLSKATCFVDWLAANKKMHTIKNRDLLDHGMSDVIKD